MTLPPDTASLPAAPSARPFCPKAQRRYVLTAAILASALGFIDGSVLAVALPAIRLSLGAGLAEAQWISNAYALTLSAFILAGGAAGDRFGLRRSFAFGILVFIAASLACALAPSASILIGLRAVQGFGAAIMVPGSLAIIAKAYPKAERGRAIGIWAAASALTTAFGPVIGGLVLSSFGNGIWRAIFAINLPLGGIAAYLLIAKVPADEPGAKRALDVGGALLATLAFGFLAYGLTALGSMPGSGVPAGAIAAGALILVAFVIWERRHHDPMIDLTLFRSSGFAGANLATFLLYFALTANLFYLPMLLIAGWTLDPAEVGFTFLPLSVLIALLSGPVGRLSDRIGPRLPITLGSLLVATACCALALMTSLHVERFWSGIFPAMVLVGLGMAMVVSPLSTAVMTSVDDRDTGAASGINNAVSRVAGLVAVAAMGALAAWSYAHGTGGAGGMPGFGETPAVTLPDAIKALHRTASDAAFAAVGWATAVLSVSAALIAWISISATVATDPLSGEAG